MNRVSALFARNTAFNLNSFFTVVGLLTIVNFLFSICFDMQVLRLVRVLTTVVFFVGFFKLEIKRSVLFNVIFALLVFSDIGLWNYESKWFCFLRFGTFILINLLLSYHIFSKSFFYKLKPFALIVIFVLFISCVFLVINLSYLLDFSVFGPVHEFLYYLYTLSTFLLVLFTVIYSLNDYSKKTDVLLGSVVAFFVSDLLLMVGYYENLYLVIQIERVFQIVAISLLIYYVVLFKEEISIQ